MSASQLRASASGSVLVSQVLGAAEMMGYGKLPVPELPVGKIAAQDPLRAAILGWIAATGSVVPADELARELARADALPLDVQRDIALLLISATDATLLQRAALARLTPDEIAWIYTNPQVAEQLAQGLQTPETTYMAMLAGKVDMEQSITASLLMLEAIDATRGTLTKAQAASKTVDSLAAGELDATTRSILELLASVQSTASDKDKVMLAAKLVSLTGGFAVPTLPAAPSFADALAELLAQTSQAPDAVALADVTKRAEALPDDLERAIAQLILAEAKAVRAANPAYLTPTSQSEALASLLVATAESLPVLEKYGLYWRGAPAALRVSEWDQAARVGWAAHHAALFLTARDDISSLASVAPMLAGHELASAKVPERSFTDAFIALSIQGGFPVSSEMLEEIMTAEASLDPAVRDAAAILMSGAAESARLQREAFGLLTKEQQDFLRFETDGLDALYAGAPMSDAELARLSRATKLAELVDERKLGQSGLVAAMATSQAQKILEGRDAYSTQSVATHVATGLRGLLARFLPVQDAAAQTPSGCSRLFQFIQMSCPEDSDTILRIQVPTFATNQMTPAEFLAVQQMQQSPRTYAEIQDPDGFRRQYTYTCDERECVLYDWTDRVGSNTFISRSASEANLDILVITGTGSKTYTPELTQRTVCNAVHRQAAGVYQPGGVCRTEQVMRYGAPTIQLDLGGDDTYQMPVGMVGINATIPASIFLDMGGADAYVNPSPLYNHASPLLRDLGYLAGHPTQGSALYGGTAIFVDSQGSDSYTASTRSQGYARLGFALLADLGADADIYRAGDMSQGASSETFTLGGAILFDRAGNDRYTVDSGQGFGVGGVLLDVGGRDRYVNLVPALGVPVADFDVLPGSSVGSLADRSDNRVWLAGPGSINIGIGIDQETIGTGQESDSDPYSDIIEFLVGTDPQDPADNPSTNPLARARAALLDSDGDGYPDYIERAFSTDPSPPAGGSSYPAGFPNLVLRVPQEVRGLIDDETWTNLLGFDRDDNTVEPFGTTSDSTGSNFTSSDKIVDLRLPLQDAGSLDYACTGQFYPNATAPMGIAPGNNVLLPVFGSLFPAVREDPNSGAPQRFADGTAYDSCVFVSYDTTSPGNGNATIPNNQSTNYRGDQFKFQMPAGILAIGDVVKTNYSADYFVVIDLGGPDDFENTAGGALVVRTTPITGGPNDNDVSDNPNDMGSQRVTNTFIAPSLVINVDPEQDEASVIDVSSSDDKYRNASRDFAHGSYFGVLVDTGGNDQYVARDASQGALGGVLLDLDGRDTYEARNLAQGASLARASSGSLPDGNNAPARRVEDLPGNGNLPMDQRGDQRIGAHRRAIPGILLDLGESPTALDGSKQTFTAGSHSQGFARGYASVALEHVNQSNAPEAYGILAALGKSDDKYDGGRFAQGVAGVNGVGILFDLNGFDIYGAKSIISQGATISQSVFTDEPTENTIPEPAIGILVDLGGLPDLYSWADPLLRKGASRTERNENLTIQRSSSHSEHTAANGALYTDVGIHLDASQDSPWDGIMGAGQNNAAFNQNPDGSKDGFHVFMPTARLAIGSDAMTAYDREFAFVVDLGGNNYYNHSAGGLIRDYIATMPTGRDFSGQTAASVYGGSLNLFPVTLVVDVGGGDSTYKTSRTFTQGSGLFGIGIISDFGGHDTLRADPTLGPALPSTWITNVAGRPGASLPVIDGSIGGDWDGVQFVPMPMRAINDTRFTREGWQIGIANDATSIYIGIKGHTSSQNATRLEDTLRVGLDMGRRQQEWDHVAKRTGIDRVHVSFDQATGACKAEDWSFEYRTAVPNTGKSYVPDADGAQRLKVGCRTTDEGEVFYEIRKDLVATFPVDTRDLEYCYDDAVGFGYVPVTGQPKCDFPSNELGLYVEFGDAGAGFYDETAADAIFTWPPGAADDDGEAGHARTGNLSDEMRSWAAVGLAQREMDGAIPRNVLTPSLAQGVGIGGVGIVAMLGTVDSATHMIAGDMSQGYASYGGLGIVLDTEGGDTYEGGSMTLGAAQTRGLALFIDAQGNDVYAPTNRSLGWTTSEPLTLGTAVFLDLSGDDHYKWRPASAVTADQARGTLEDGQLAPPGNNIVWSQGSPAGSAAPGSGVGADYKFLEAIRTFVAKGTIDALFGITTTTFNLTYYDELAPGPWGNHCTDREVAEKVPTGKFADYRVRGKVCFVATVNTGNGAVYSNYDASSLDEALAGPVDGLLTERMQNMTVGGTVNVSAVEFLIDRARVASTLAKVDANHTLSRWAAPVDLSAFPDGVARGKALPLFSAQLSDGLGTYLFQEDIANTYEENEPGVRTLLIDNAPIPKVALEPAFTGIANATFSAAAYGSQQNLYVNYTVNHDVGEDRYAQANNWRPARDLSHIPCVGVPEATAQEVTLCNTLPFYLGGDVLTTEPGTDPAPGPDSFIFESPAKRGNGDSYQASTRPLQSELKIYTNESFHLAIPNRTSFLQTEHYTTEVMIKVYKGEQEAKNADGTIWYLGYELETAPPEATVDAASGLGGVFGSAQGYVDTAGRTAESAVRALQGNTLLTATDAGYATVCAGWENPWCRAISGRPVAGGGTEMCATDPPSNFPASGLIGAHVWNARKQVDNAARASPTGQAVICHAYYSNVNATSREYGDEPSAVTSQVGDIAADVVTGVNDILKEYDVSDLASEEVRVDGVHFEDIWFDTNKTLPALNHCMSPGDCIRFEGNALVVPKGMTLKLSFGLVGDSADCAFDLCDTYAGAVTRVRENYTEAIDSSPVGLWNPGGLSNFYPLQQVNDTFRFQQDGGTVRDVLEGQSVPSSAFYVRAGAPRDQPRLEVRVPAEPTTTVSLSIDPVVSGESVSLRSGSRLVGDLPGTPTRNGGVLAGPGTPTAPGYWQRANESPHINWTVTNEKRWSQNTYVYSASELVDGLYRVNVHANDGWPQPGSASESLLIDHTAPSTFLVSDKVAGKASLDGPTIPVKWSTFEAGSGIREVWLYHRTGAGGDLTQDWTGPVGPFAPGTRTFGKVKDAAINEYLFMTVGVDRAGNVEDAASTPDAPIDTLADALKIAFATKLSRGDSDFGYRLVRVDEADPIFSSVGIEGGRLLSYQGSEFTFARAGAPLKFTICALDDQTGIGRVTLSLDHLNVTTRALINQTFTATAGGPCGPSGTGTLFTSENWTAVNTDSTRYPEGIWSAMFEVFDAGGNRIRVPAGNLILDHRSPTVSLQPPVLPAGQSAVKPGDAVKIRIVSSDNFGVDDGGIRVDASKFAKNASALKTKSVRVNGVIYQEAQFTVDLPNLQNGVFDVVVSVPDLAGNVTTERTQIAVNFKPFEFVPGSVRISNVTHNALTLHWKTNEPTSALAKFGTTSIGLTGRTPQDINATLDHALRVEGLQPSTHYFLRAVAVSAGGFTKESETIEADTGSALFLSPISPVSGDKVSGLVRIKFRGGLLDSSDFVSYTLEIRDSADAAKPWTFLTTATRQGDSHELTWNSTRFLDGTTYQLRLTAVAGTGAAADRTSIVIDRLTSDNSPPSVIVLSPLLATNDTTPLLTAEASDALSGLASTQAQLLIDGVAVSGNVTREQLPAGRVRLTHAFVQPLDEGIRTFELRVADLAGNVAKETWKVAIDGDAPNVTIEKTRFAPGTGAAKRGGTVTLNLTITDLSGVSLAVADTSELNTVAGSTRLVKLVNTDSWQGTVAVTAAEASAIKDVPVRVVDLAGNQRTVTISVPVDNVAPQISATSIAEVKHRRAVIDVPANEPILVNGTATAPASPPATAATATATSTARLTFDGLLPSRTYSYKLTAMDRAGNPVDLAGSFATLQDTTPPGAVGPVSVLDLLNGTLRLTWAPATDDVLVSHYRVYRSDDGVTFRVIAETTAPTHEDSGLPYEKTYVYKVAAVDYGANEGEASPSLRASATAVPRLSVGVVAPTMGSTSTTFRYTVTYLSPGGVSPAYVRIILDGVPQNMTLESGTPLTGAVYVYETRLAPHKRDAPHTYAYEASDGRYTVRFPESGDVMRGPLVGGDGLGEEDVTGFGAFAQRVPLGGVAGVAIAMLAAVGLAALLRRKKEGSK